jgi:hypothetical protein
MTAPVPAISDQTPAALSQMQMLPAPPIIGIALAAIFVFLHH